MMGSSSRDSFESSTMMMHSATVMRAMPAKKAAAPEQEGSVRDSV
jgi:hypothetical protein